MDVLERPGAVATRDGQGRRRRRVAHLARQVEEVYHKQRGTIGLPLSHRLSQAVGIGASTASQPPTCSLKSHLTVRCVRPGANMSWHFASTAFTPQFRRPQLWIWTGPAYFGRSVSIKIFDFPYSESGLNRGDCPSIRPSGDRN